MVLEEKRITSPGVRQCLKILSWISRVPQGVGFNELRERVFQIPPSTLTRHLRVLIEENWVKKNQDGLYQAGPAYLCAVTNITGKPNPDGMIRPVINRLAHETGHSAAFAEWDRGAIRYRLSQNRPGSFHYPPVDQPIEQVFSHPFGLTALANLPLSILQWNMETRPAEISPSPEELMGVLERIKGDGIYLGHLGCDRVCAPVFYNNDDLAGVIGLSVLGDGEPFKSRVKEAAQEIESLSL